MEHWIKDEKYLSSKKAKLVCSGCGHYRMVTALKFQEYNGFNVRYCENCGARMEPYVLKENK